MKVEDLPVGRAAELLSGAGLRIRYGPVNIRVSSNYPQLFTDFYPLYSGYEIVPDEIADFHLHIKTTRALLRPLSRRLSVMVDGHSPFPAVPASQAIASLQQSINWVLVTRIWDLVNFRAAVVERNGHAVLLPETSRQSEAARISILLAHKGYRLLSGEFGLLEPISGSFCPLPGPVPVGSDALAELGAIVQAPASAMRVSCVGTGAYVAAPAESVERSQEYVAARWIIIPQRTQNARPSLEPLKRSEAFMMLASQSFNYELLGANAFTALTQLVMRCECYRLVYSDLSSVLTLVSELTDEC